MMHFLWSEKYRPNTVEACVLPTELKSSFQAFVDTKNIPNLILTGLPGVGKTTVAIAMLEELDCDYIKINASLERGVDVLRDKIANFASTVAFSEGRKYVILDEADGMLATMQDGLKGFIEEYSANCGFILTCNNLNKLIGPIRSRCQVMEFDFPQDEYKPLMNQFLKFLAFILKEEKIEYDKAVLVAFAKNHYPHYRQAVIRLQGYSMKGRGIDTGILANARSASLDGLLPILKGKLWDDMVAWVAENPSAVADFSSFARNLYDALEPLMKPQSKSDYVLAQNDHDFKDYFVKDKTANVMAFLQTVMACTIYK